MPNKKKNLKRLSPETTIRRSPVLLALRILILQVILALLIGSLSFLVIFIDSTTQFQIAPLSLFALIMVSLIILDFLFTVYTILSWFNMKYIIKPKLSELVVEEGILSHKEKAHSLETIHTVTYTKGPLGRLFNFGTIRLYSPTLKQEIFCYGIPNPEDYVDIFKSVIPKLERESFLTA